MGTGKASESVLISEVEGPVEEWTLAKKKGGRGRVKEIQIATRKSSCIQDQGIPMQEKAAMLKSIQNLESQGTTASNPFNILNNASVKYLEFVASSCGIALGSTVESPHEVISAMQAQEVARCAIAQAELVSNTIQQKKGAVEQHLGCEDNQLAVITND